MKKKLIATTLSLAVLGGSLLCLNCAFDTSSKASSFTANTEVTHQSDNSILDPSIEKALNQKGVTDTEINNLSSQNISELNECSTPNEIEVTKCYYDYNEETGEFILSSDNESDSKEEETGAVQKKESRVATKTLSTTLIASPTSKNGILNIQILCTWYKIPQNLGYDVISLELGSNHNLQKKSATTAYTYRVYKKNNPGNPNSSYTATDYQIMRKSNSKFVFDYCSTTNALAVKTPKLSTGTYEPFMPVTIFNSLSKQDKNIKKLTKQEMKSFDKYKGDALRLEGITFTISATTRATAKYVNMSTLYYHHVKKLSINPSITAGVPPTVSGNIDITISEMYQRLPSSTRAALTDFQAKK